MGRVKAKLASVLCAAVLAAPAAAGTPMLTEAAKLTASDGAGWDRFGRSVSVNGDTAVVGAPHDDDNGDRSGSAYIFVRSGSTWTEQAKLTASDSAAGDRFGESVSVSGDTVVVGAQCGDVDIGNWSGSAYVFVRSGTTWTEQAKLLASDGVADDRFGCSVSVSGDTAVVGACNGDGIVADSGSAYVFVRSGTTWTEQAKLVASDGAVQDWLGWSVSVDGDTAVVGAMWDDDNGTDSGSAYVYVRSGSTWSEQAKLLPGDGTAEDCFGYSVTVDGDMAVVGAYVDDDNGSSSGSAYVYVRSGLTWTEQAKLLPGDGAAGDRFGQSVSVSGDTAVVGARHDDDKGLSSGSAYVFVGSGSTWTEQAKLTASDGAGGDYFGWCVSVDAEGAVVGAPYDDENAPDSGSACFFDFNQHPTVDITAPSDGASFAPGDDITIVAAASDTNGTVTQVEFFRNGASIGLGTDAGGGTWSITWTSVPEGGYAVTAVATDDGGATTESAPVKIVAGTTVSIGATQDAAEPSTDGLFTVTRSGDTTGPITVGFTLDAAGTATEGVGNDFTLSPASSVDFAAGETAKTITVIVQDDALVEGIETVVVGLSPGAGYGLGWTPSARVAVADDEIDPDLVAWWEFNETGGLAAADSTGKGNDGTLMNMIGDEWTTGAAGGALRLDGTDDYVWIREEADFELRGQITVSAWIKISAFTEWCQAIVTKGDTSWRLQRDGETDNLEFSCTGLSPWQLTGNATLVCNQWYHVAGVYDGAALRLYVDGRLDASVASSGTVSTNGNPVLIGENAQRPGRQFDGWVDDVRVYSRALSAAEVLDLYNETREEEPTDEAVTPFAGGCGPLERAAGSPEPTARALVLAAGLGMLVLFRRFLRREKGEKGKEG